MRVKVLGKYWTLTFVPTLGAHGDCDDVSRTIRIKQGQSDRDTLDTVIHESLHAAAFDMFDESYVDKLATDISIILTRLGYKRQEK